MASTELDHRKAAGAEVLDAEEASAVESQIKAAIRDGRNALWRLAEALYAFNEMKGWQRLNYETLGEWLAEPDITMTRSSFFRLVQTWKELHVVRKIDSERLRGLDQSKTSVVVASIVKGKATIDDALSDVEALGFRDLREKYGPPEDESKRSDSGENLARTGSPTSGQAPGAQQAQEASSDPPPSQEAQDPDPGEASSEDGFVALDEADETTTKQADALADAELLGWDEILAAYRSGAAFARVDRRVIEGFLAWRDKHLG